VLSTRFRNLPSLEDAREDVRYLQDDLKQRQRAQEKVESEIEALQANEKHLTKLEGFSTVGQAFQPDGCEPSGWKA